MKKSQDNCSRNHLPLIDLPAKAENSTPIPAIKKNMVTAETTTYQIIAGNIINDRLCVMEKEQ